MSARIAGLAILAAEVTAVATRSDGPSTLLVWTVLVAPQIVVVVWATDRRSSVVLRMVAPALLTAVTVAAIWTALALAVPVIATGDAAALVAILGAGAVVAASSRRSADRRLLPLVLIASAGSALLIFLIGTAHLADSTKRAPGATGGFVRGGKRRVPRSPQEHPAGSWA